ncbi:coiled coil domain containing protein 34 [Echinococcus multilocularis]|uniref:Coiled coil domain containing protein 34 n=1 Tax=Echinococcus multilocularis TaxID=6211 RepID=A0A068YJM4_ECHMU|nr:coiled coil domain containing protein 34 [Echinococcus multilocularis]
MGANVIHHTAESNDSIQSLFSGISLTNLELSYPSTDNDVLSGANRINRKVSRLSEASESRMRRHLSAYSGRKMNYLDNNSDESHTHLIRTHLLAPYIRKTSSKVVPPQDAPSLNSHKNALASSLSASPGDRNNNGVHLLPLQKRLTPWERWMAKKEADRDKATLELTKLKAQNESKRQLEEQKRLERKRIEKAKVQEWIENKNMDAMKQKKLAEIARLAQKAEATKKKAQQIRAKEKYQEWLKRKRKEEQAESRRYEEERYVRELAFQEKRRQADASFQAWLRSHKVSATAANRRSPHSYCIADGMLIKYFDRTSAPEPEFFNKKDWIS